MTIVIVIAAIVALTVLGVVAVLTIVLVGVRNEDRCMSLTSSPHGRIEAVTRRLLGVGVRTPGPCDACDKVPARSDRP